MTTLTKESGSFLSHPWQGDDRWLTVCHQWCGVIIPLSSSWHTPPPTSQEVTSRAWSEVSKFFRQ